MQKREFEINIDGGSRGNPGPAAYGFVIRHEGDIVFDEGGYLGKTTNNVAEYNGLIRALEQARELQGTHLKIASDSQLIVFQIDGTYRVKSPDLKPLYEQATKLIAQFEDVKLRHVYREDNTEADRLCNEAMDRAGRPGSTLSSKNDSHAPPSSEKKRPDWAATRTEAAEILQDAAQRWADSGIPESPAPAAVLDKIFALLEGRKYLNTKPRRKKKK